MWTFSFTDEERAEALAILQLAARAIHEGDHESGLWKLWDLLSLMFEQNEQRAQYITKEAS